MNYFYNAHTHIFNLDHVPDEFARGYFSIFGMTIKLSWLRKVGALRWLIKKIPNLKKKSDFDMAERLINLVKHGEGQDGKGKTQEEIFQNLQSYYPPQTRYVVLPMDMEYMGAGKVAEPFRKQIDTIEQIKINPKYTDLIYPFIFLDPRRISDEPDYSDYVIDKLNSGRFAGIKMYPALGYWPFDQRLEKVYDFACEKQIPIMTHCVRGVVHDRGPKQNDYHPIKTEAFLPGKQAKEYTQHYTHPINFHCILDKEIISNYWKKEKDYSELKVCMGHFGGAEEWLKYLKTPWTAANSSTDDVNYPALGKDNWKFKLETEEGDYSWFSVIWAMMSKHKNLYADISFMLHERETWPLIKLLLNTSHSAKQRMLFGTDFYVVAQKGTERELSIGIRSYLDEKHFEQIALTNVESYLKTTIN